MMKKFYIRRIITYLSPTMNKILLIEDDVGISTSLKLYLSHSSFEIYQYYEGSGACEYFQEISPDLVILDVNLPGKNGFQICEEIRNISQIPIIILTAKNTENATIAGFEKWADDYVAKPFSPKELLARIQSLLKRYKDIKNTATNKKWMLKFKNIALNLDTTEVFLDAVPLSLTKNEYDILEILLLSDGNIVTREELMRDAIGYENYMYDRTLDTHMKNLRKKLGDTDYIVTIRGKWYRLTA